NITEAFDAATSPLPALFGDALKRAEQGVMSPLRRQFAQGAAPGAEGDELSSELMATATPFGGGIVFVIDDMSNISKAQREAAWREVARRIAHEIKNPLTPIKLSAQRLQKKFASN